MSELSPSNFQPQPIREPTKENLFSFLLFSFLFFFHFNFFLFLFIDIKIVPIALVFVYLPSINMDPYINLVLFMLGKWIVLLVLVWVIPRIISYLS